MHISIYIESKRERERERERDREREREREEYQRLQSPTQEDCIQGFHQDPHDSHLT